MVSRSRKVLVKYMPSYGQSLPSESPGQRDRQESVASIVRRAQVEHLALGRGSASGCARWRASSCRPKLCGALRRSAEDLAPAASTTSASAAPWFMHAGGWSSKQGVDDPDGVTMVAPAQGRREEKGKQEEGSAGHSRLVPRVSILAHLYLWTLSLYLSPLAKPAFSAFGVPA